MDIAIKFEKIDLGDFKIVFKPVGVIRGTYYSEEDYFETDYGDICESFTGKVIYDDNYFGYAMSLKQLMEYYPNMTEEEALECYYNTFYDNYYVGFCDLEKEELKVIKINASSVFDFNFNNANNNVESLDSQSNQIILGTQELEQLRNLDDVEEYHQLFDEMINILSDNKKDDDKDLVSDTPSISKSLFITTKDNKSPMKLQKEESKKMIGLKELREEVKASIIGQDKAVDDVTRQIIINMTSKNYRNKSHIFITGPSGTGKTEIVSLIAKRLGLPVFKANATEYSKAGYVGKETNSMLAGLISAAGGDVKKAEQGFLIIDEMDKVVLGSSQNENFDKAIIFALLKMMDRDVVEVDMDHYNSVLFDTSNLNIIFMGAFSEYLKEKEKYEQKPMGFNSKASEKKKKSRITQEDLIKNFGAEFVGRLGRITSTDELSLEDVIKILYDSKISQYKVIKEDLLERGVELDSDDEFITEVAKQGYSEETGVRNLNKTVKEKFDYIYDEILTDEKVKSLKITKETALDPTKYTVNY